MATTKIPRILLIYTGGTIGMIENAVNHALEPFDFDHLIDNVPKIKMLGYEIEHVQFATPIDSSSMNPKHWGEIAEVIERHYDSVDGFVVLHMVREVAILFEHHLWRGNRCIKRSADNFDAFKSNNYPELASIGLGIHFNRASLWRNDSRNMPLKVQYEMDDNLVMLDLFPGISRKVVEHVLNAPGLKGVVMKSFGAGNAPADEWFLDAVRQTVERGIVVVNITQCPNGCVHPQLYAAGLNLAKVGVVSGRDMTSEAAITKLMYLFGRGLSPDKVKEYLNMPLRGEMSAV